MSRRAEARDLASIARAGLKRLDEVRRMTAPAGIATSAEIAPDSASSSTFLRGLVMGALVGAAIAGSTVWERRRSSRREGSTRE